MKSTIPCQRRAHIRCYRNLLQLPCQMHNGSLSFVRLRYGCKICRPMIQGMQTGRPGDGFSAENRHFEFGRPKKSTWQLSCNDYPGTGAPQYYCQLGTHHR